MPLLSHKNGIGSEIIGTIPRLVMNFFNETASLDASLAAMYLASIIEFTIVGYLELFQDIALPFKVNRNLHVNLLFFGCDRKLESL